MDEDKDNKIDPHLHHPDCEAFIRHNRYTSAYWHNRLATRYPKLYQIYRLGFILKKWTLDLAKRRSI